jgi:hypothetical protein
MDAAGPPTGPAIRSSLATTRFRARSSPTPRVALSPDVYARRYDASLPWLDAEDASALDACPDAANPVALEIRRLPRGLLREK